jgi:hypothetical protein
MSILTKLAFFNKFYTFSSTSISVYTVINIGLTQNYKQKLYLMLHSVHKHKHVVFYNVTKYLYIYIFPCVCLPDDG